jgi:polyferredoxin
MRPRTLLYGGMITLVGLIMVITLANRSQLDVNILADRNPFYVRLSNGDIRNGYTLKILNKLHEPRRFDLDIEGLDGAKLSIIGQENSSDPEIAVPTDVLSEVRVFVALPRANFENLGTSSTHFTFLVRDKESGRVARRLTTFRGP